jgi:parvulin-like peptidyl-prolyl isomerase
MEILASLTENKPIPKDLIQTKDGYFVVGLSRHEPVDQNKFQSMKNNIENRLIYQKQEEAFQNWINQLRLKAKIDINKEFRV